MRVIEQIGSSSIEIFLEACHVLFQHAKGVEGAVVSQLAGLRYLPHQTFQVGRVSQQHGAKRRPGLSIRIARRVVNLLESRLRDVIPIAEVNAVAEEAAALAYTE